MTSSPALARGLFRRDILAASLGGLAAACPGVASAAAGWDRAGAMDAVIDAAVRDGHIVGATVLAAQGGAVIYRRSAGYADREAGRPMAEDELYRLASMTKAIVCVAALALVDRGLLHLDDTVTRWLPRSGRGWPTGANPSSRCSIC